MILHKFGEKLYSGVVATMTFHVQEMARSVAATEGSSFLEELNTKWNNHSNALEMIRDILMYANRTYIPMTNKTPVYELGLNLWRENVIYSNQIWTRLSNTLLELVCKYCAGEDVNGELIGNITKMLMDLVPSVYEKEFETPFLQVIADFYRAKSQKFIECCDDPVDYLKKAERHLNEEMDRLSRYLDIRTKRKITNILEKEIIENHMIRLIHMENSWVVNMLCSDKYDDLGRIYNLFRHVPDGLSKMREVMTSHSRESIKQLVTDQERLKDPIEFVQRILDEKDKYDKIRNLEFNNNKLFQNALNSSFGFFINLNPCTAEYLSLFVDDKFRKGLKGVNEDDVKITLEKVTMLCGYLHEKDVLEKYYRQHLGKRLLFGETVSDDAERSLMIMLKKECGYQFTSRACLQT